MARETLLPLSNGDNGDEWPPPLANMTSLRAERLRLRWLLFEGSLTCDTTMGAFRLGDRYAHHARLLFSPASQELPFHRGHQRQEAEVAAGVIRDRLERTNRALETFLRGQYDEPPPSAAEDQSDDLSLSMDSVTYSAEDSGDPLVPSCVQLRDSSAESSEHTTCAAAGPSCLNRLNLFRQCSNGGASASGLPSKVDWMEEGRLENKTCPICFEYKEEIVQFPHAHSPDGDTSDHKMCRDCFIRNGDNVCPMCRGPRKEQKRQQNALLVLNRLLWG